MDAAVAGLVGAGIGALAGFAGTWLSLRHENKRWKRQRIDETYQLLGEWLSEEWEWARTINSIGIESEDSLEPRHERHRQVEVMVTLHGSKQIDALMDAYSSAYVKFQHAGVWLGRPDAYAPDPPVNRIGELQAALALLQSAGDQVWDQMRAELN